MECNVYVSYAQPYNISVQEAMWAYPLRTSLSQRQKTEIKLFGPQFCLQLSITLLQNQQDPPKKRFITSVLKCGTVNALLGELVYTRIKQPLDGLPAYLPTKINEGQTLRNPRIYS